MFNHGSRSTWGPGPSGSRLQAKKCVTLQQKHWCVLHLKFYYVFTKTHGCRATPSHFGPHYPWFCVRAKSRKLRRDLVDLWEGTLQLYYNKLSLKMIDRGSRSTRGPKSIKIQIAEPKTWSAPTKTGLAYNFCFIKFLPSCTVEAVDAPQNLFRSPLIPG